MEQGEKIRKMGKYLIIKNQYSYFWGVFLPFDHGNCKWKKKICEELKTKARAVGKWKLNQKVCWPLVRQWTHNTPVSFKFFLTVAKRKLQFKMAPVREVRLVLKSQYCLMGCTYKISWHSMHTPQAWNSTIGVAHIWSNLFTLDSAHSLQFHIFKFYPDDEIYALVTFKERNISYISPYHSWERMIHLKLHKQIITKDKII